MIRKHIDIIAILLLLGGFDSVAGTRLAPGPLKRAL